MNAFPAFILSGIIAAMAVPASAQAAESKVTYPAFNDGSHIHGPKLKASDLKGKVVFFEYWGINCPPCIASMPHLQELQEKFQSKVFTVIGSHSQLPSPRVKQFLEEKKITFPIYQYISRTGGLRVFHLSVYFAILGLVFFCSAAKLVSI